MNDEKQQSEQQELRDLDVPENDAEDVKGGRPKFGQGHSDYIVVTQKDVLISN